MLEQTEPPAGSLRVAGGRPARGPRAGQVIRFAGWLGLLRALYEVTGPPAAPRSSGR